MSTPPRKILSDAFKDALRGRRVRTLLFTTFTFDSGFFESEILPVFLDAETAVDSRRLRLARIEDQLLTLTHRPQVFYDVGQLVTGGRGGACLDFGRHPVRLSGGRAFHPKVVCALVEEPAEDGKVTQELLVACASANLTESGWWENVECAHIEAIAENSRTALRGPLISFLEWLGKNGLAVTPAEAVELSRRRFSGTALGEIMAFLTDKTRDARRSTKSDLLETKFCFSDMVTKKRWTDFLKEAAGRKLDGMYLEVISPYLDKSANSKALEDLIVATNPREVRVYLPEDREGKAAVSRELFDAGRKHPDYGNIWGRFDMAMIRNGPGTDAKKRFVHAKVYRFFRKMPRQEIWFVGSHNMTTAAHQNGGNMECGFLVERTIKPGEKPDFWLKEFKGNTECSAPPPEEEPLGNSDLNRLAVRYDWSTGDAEAFWDQGGNESVRPPKDLRLEEGGIELGKLPDLSGRDWVKLSRTFSARVGEHLVANSHFNVLSGDESAIILVQENGMSRKPGLLEQLSVAEILRYWSLLTVAQKEELEDRIISRMEGAMEEGSIAAIGNEAGFFEEVSGFFHAFDRMEKAVTLALQEGREQFAEARFFGKKHDSMGRMLEMLLEKDRPGAPDAVGRYILLLCARQTLDWLKRVHREFWDTHSKSAKKLHADVAGWIEEVRTEIRGEDDGMEDFLGWFEKEFLRREAREPEVAV